ncbi:F-box/LRR-repeat protein 14, partial [Biomphalaria glabrata]
LLDLPDELLVHICSFLDGKDLANFAQTCIIIKNAAHSKHIWNFRGISINIINKIQKWISIYQSLNDRGVVNIFFKVYDYDLLNHHFQLFEKYLPNLKLVYEESEYNSLLVQRPRGDINIKGLRLRKVETLKVTNINNHFLEELKNAFPSLKYLNVSEGNFDDNHANIIEKLNVKALNLARTQITNRAIFILCRPMYHFSEAVHKYEHEKNSTLSSNLEILNTANNLNVTSKSWKFLKALDKLKVLITNDTFAGYEEFNHLSSIKSLRFLVIKHSTWPEKVLINVSKLKCISLGFENCDFRSDGLELLDNLKEDLEKILYLKLSNSSVSDSGIIKICENMPQLILMDLRGSTDITDECMKTIASKLLNLKFLSVLNCPKITENALQVLPNRVCVQFKSEYSLKQLKMMALKLEKYDEIWKHFVYVNYDLV